MQTITATIMIEYEYKKDAYPLFYGVESVQDAVRADIGLLEDDSPDDLFINLDQFLEWLAENELIIKRDIEVKAND